MDQKRNEQGQQSQDLDREPEDGSEDVIGRGNEKERNSGGISDSDMDRDNQDDLQDDDFSQSER